VLKKAIDLCADKSKTFDDFDDYWDAALDYQSFRMNEYFTAIGGATLKSTGSFRLTKMKVSKSVARNCCCVLVSGRVKHEFIDRYNWDRGKGTPFPRPGGGIMIIRDDDMKALEGTGVGQPKAFDMHAQLGRGFQGKICNNKWVSGAYYDMGAPGAD